MTRGAYEKKNWTPEEEALIREAAQAIQATPDPAQRTRIKRDLAARLGRTLAAVDNRVRDHLRAARGNAAKPQGKPWPADLEAQLIRMALRGVQAEEIARRLGRGAKATRTKIEELRAAGRLPQAPRRPEHVSQHLGPVPQNFPSVVEAVRFVNQVGYYTVTPCRGRWSIDGGPAVDALQVIDLARFEVAVLTGGAP